MYEVFSYMKQKICYDYQWSL